MNQSNSLDDQITSIQNQIKTLEGSGLSGNSQQIHDLNSQLTKLLDERSVSSAGETTNLGDASAVKEDTPFLDNHVKATKQNEPTRSKKYEDARR